MKKAKRKVLKAAIEWWSALSEYNGVRKQIAQSGPAHTDAPKHECPACSLVGPLEEKTEKATKKLLAKVEKLVEKTP